MTHQLVVIQLRSLVVQNEPPGSRSDSSTTDVATDSEVAEEEPARNERIRGASWGPCHDVQVRRVEAEGSCRETVSNEVDPEQLDWDQCLGQAKSSSQEDTDD